MQKPFPLSPHLKTFAVVLAILTMLVLALSACSTPTTDIDAPSQSVTFMITGGPEEQAAYEKLVNSFNEANPGITVTLSNIPSGGEFRQKLATMFSAGSPPDVFLYNFRRLGVYASEGAIYPLDSLLDNSEKLNREDYYPAVLTAFTYNGALQCMPQNVSSPVIYYNQALFDAAGLPYPQAGWTLDDFVATARALTKDTNGDGTIDQYGFGTEVETIRLAPFVWQNGGDLLDNPENPTRLTLDMPETREALEWFVNLQVVEHVVPDKIAEEASSSENRFLAGTLAMFMDSRVAVPTLRTITGFTWDAAPLPTGKNPVSVLHSDGFCMSAQAAQDPAHLQAVWKFIEYAGSETGQILLAETGRTVPSMISVAQSDAYLKSSPPANNQVWLDAAANLRAFPIHPQWNTLEEMLAQELQRAYYGEATIDEIIDAANQAADEIINGN
ncbi:MAG: sugar ABC transporter substrate-binding protein [Anaerolineales bacterium]